MNIVDLCLLVAIVGKGWATKVIAAAKSHGATGATTVLGRGVGSGDNQKIFGLEIEPEQEVVMIILQRGIADSVINEVYESVGLDEKGKGLAFIVPIEHIVGKDFSVTSTPENESAFERHDIPETKPQEKHKEAEKKPSENEPDNEDNVIEVPNIWPDAELIPNQYKVEK